MNDAIADAITAAAQVPDMTTDTARFPDGWTVTRHVIRYPARTERDPDTNEPTRRPPYTQYAFDVRTPDGQPFNASTRIMFDPEDR